MKRTYLVLLLVVSLVLIITCSNSLTTEPTAVEYDVYLTGKIMNADGNPVSKAVAALPNRGLADTTGADGVYQIVVARNTTDEELTKVAGSDYTSDTLYIAKDDQIISTFALTALVDTLPDLSIVQRDVWGSFGGCDSIEIGSIKAILKEEGINGSKSIGLWFNEASCSFSGFIYFEHISTEKNYSVYVRVYNDSSSFIGRSQTVTFPSTAGNVQIPTFSPYRPPFVTAQNDTIVSLARTDSVTISVLAQPADENCHIERYYWNVNRSDTWTDSTDIPKYTIHASVGNRVEVIWAAKDNDGLLSEIDQFTVVFNRSPENIGLNVRTDVESWITFDAVGKNGTISVAFVAEEPDNDSVSYQLYVGEKENSLRQVYSGTAQEHQLENVAPSSVIHFKLVVSDNHGDSAVVEDFFNAPPSPDLYTATFDLNGGDSLVPYTKTVAAGFPYDSLPVPTRDDHSFGGWWTEANGDGVRITEDSIPTGNTTLYAKWEWTGIITDGSGNMYRTVKIGDQVWTVENLRATHYACGTPIPQVKNNKEWSEISSPAFSHYNNTDDSASICKFGNLYNWHVIDPLNSKQIAPEGWRVPTENDWMALRNYLSLKSYDRNGRIAKSLAAQTDWAINPNSGSIGNDLGKNNSSGFSALPSGFRNASDGSFSGMGQNGNWWCSTNGCYEPIVGWLGAYGSTLGYKNVPKNSGNSIRLVKGNPPPPPNIYTVSFHSYGGTDVPSVQIEHGCSFELPPKPEKTGFYFGGWYKDEKLTQKWDPETIRINSDMILYAKWLSPDWLDEIVTDGDGNVYSTVRIGTQIWTVENLRTTSFMCGTPITELSGYVEDTITITYPAYCTFSSDQDSIAKYGLFYNYYVIDTCNSEKIAPEGWRVPTRSDWYKLQRYLIDEGYQCGTDVGVAKSMAAQESWATSNINGAIGNDLSENNSSGFSALPAGYFNKNAGGYYPEHKESGYWWGICSDPEYPYVFGLNYNMETIMDDAALIYFRNEFGFSVRLVKDAE